VPTPVSRAWRLDGSPPDELFWPRHEPDRCNPGCIYRMAMLTIRKTQMVALGSGRLAAFFARAQSFIAAQLRRPVDLAEIEALYARGQAYGLKSEQDFVRYMFVAVAVGASGSAGDPDWMRAILDVRTPANDLKLRRLFDEAQRHVPPGLVPPSTP
jgi:hypothetical protein